MILHNTAWALPFLLLAITGMSFGVLVLSCPHTCPCTSDDECPHDCTCEDDE